MTPATVRKPEALELGLDHRGLLELGLGALRGYARLLWTDHNVHDPGITTLEQLCYALSELCYRACQPIEDLLAAPDNDRLNMARQFPAARAALPNAPLTALDYRKLALDVPGVRNAWILPYAAPTYYADPVEGKLLHEHPALPGIREVHLRGLHRVLIEHALRAPAEERTAVEAAVRAAFRANRNLCEDFVEIAAVEPQAFIACGEIQLEPDADPGETHAAILLAVQRYLAPGVPRHRREELLRRPLADGTPRTEADLFDGPAPLNGFIDAAELEAAALRGTIRLSDVIGDVMDIHGVRAVRSLVIRPADAADSETETRWEVKVKEGSRATLDPAQSRLVLYKSGMPLPRPADAVQRYEALRDDDEKRYAPRPSGSAPQLLGRYRNAGEYVSVQEHFPELYGVGSAALPAGSSVERRAQALQFQAYLLFFDQIMANDCAQLASVRELFSLDPDPQHSYFTQPVDVVRALYPPPAAGTVESAEAWRQRIGELLGGLAENEPGMLARRNRFLDHLMARFAERLQDYLAIQSALFGATPAAALHAKCAFLSQYPELAAGRGLGFDYTKTAPDNVSGLEKRLAHLLGLGALAHDIYQERDVDGVDEFRFRVRRRFTAGVLLSSTRHWRTPEEALAEMSQALDSAQRAAGYRRTHTADGRFSFNLVDAAGEVVARRIQYFATAAQRDAAIDELMRLVGEHRSERLCVIENILLRPRPDTNADPFLPICAEPDCGPACPGDDPYSYRLHIVLPALAGRFRSMDFRRFAEDVIRQETPAHLLPKVCWVNDEDMTRIEQAWAAWRALLAGTEATGRAARLSALRDALYRARNVYPAPTLADCQAQEKFILGRSALGSVEGTPP